MKTPCQEDPEVWVSDFTEIRAEAVAACQTCPVLAECKAGRFGTPGRDDIGVWAGVDYSTQVRAYTVHEEGDDVKVCAVCDQDFRKSEKESWRYFATKRHCSHACAGVSRRGKRKASAA